MHRRGMQDDIPVGDWYDFTIIDASSFQNFAGLGSERFFFFEMFTQPSWRQTALDLTPHGDNHS